MLKTSTDQRKPLPNFEHLFATTAQAPGGVARLRELILTLAVQGKLVAQDANDEPASELLKKIRAEKERLIAEGKIKKDKPLPAITEDEKPFELPVGWEWVRLQQAYDVRDGTHDTPKYHASGIPLVTSKNIYSGELCLNDVKYISIEDHLKISERSKVEKGDILFAMIGSIGNPVIVNTQEEFSVKNVALFKYYAKHLSSSKFLLCLLNSAAKKIKEKAGGGVQAFISLAQLRSTVIGLPPLAEQSRIVTRVEELMSLCDALEEKGRLEHTQHQQLLQAMLDSLTQTTDAQELARHWQRLAQHFDLLIDRPEAVDALEQTILQLAVRGLLVPQDANDEPASELLKKIRVEKDRLIAEGKIKKDKPLPAIGEDEKPFKLPKGWDWVKVANVFETVSGGTFSPEMEKDSGSYMYVKVGDMNLSGNEFSITTSSRFIDPDEKALNALIPSGSIIFPKRGGAIATNKKRVVVKPIFVDLNTMAITPIVIPTEYALLWLMTIDLASLNTGTSVPQINHKDIDPLPFPLPPLAEQSRIVARVTELRALCQQLRDKLTQARTTQTQLAQAWVEQVA